MSDIDDVLEAAVDRGEVPGVVAMAATKDGSFYSGAFGKRSIAGDQDMTVDTVFRIFSMTKAVGTTAAMQLVERGLLDLDAPVDSILPEFGELQVLEGFDGDKPRMRAPKTKATVRQLATHTSGLCYEFWNADTAKYLEVTGNPGVLSGLKQGLFYPLTFDPGTKWDYGISTDWLGRVVEEVSGKRLDRYYRDEIFAPLGMTDTAFECEDAMRDRLVTVHRRGPNDELDVTELDPPSHPEFYGAGHGLYSTASDYTQFLVMLLKRGTHNGAQVLRPETVDLMCQNHIGELEIGNLISVAPAVSNDAEFFPGMAKKHGLGFMINMEQVPEGRAAGSLCWAGALNTYFWFDPSNGIAGAILMQLMPFADHKAIELLVDFERAVYAGS